MKTAAALRLSALRLSALVGLALCAAAAPASQACPPGVPAGVGCGGPDLAAATAGTYKLDGSHASVIARVSHLGYSYSIFRFDRIEGTLAWDPARPEASRLSVSVDTSSIATNVPGFAAELAGDKFLKSAAFPKATFVSTAFRRTDATRGKVDGQFTLMGRTRPVTFDVALVGAGKGFGKPRLGVHGRATIDPGDYGLPASMAAPIELVIDTEFERTT